MKLKESIPSNSLKIIDLYNKIDSGLLVTGPDFQRKLVWKKQHKYAFIQTILLNYPFPEVYVASQEMDIEQLRALEIVVDGQQRLTTIVEYIKGVGDFANQNKVPNFDDLPIEEKKEFLNYSVTVKDLKSIGIEKIKEIFQRINSTDYSLNENERLNARFGDGEFAIFCKILSDKKFVINNELTDITIDSTKRDFITDFFVNHNIFTENDVKRMFNSQYLMLITSTLLEGGYFGRSARIEHYIEKYNLEFSIYPEILSQLINSLEIIESLKFSNGSYWFNKANLFNLIVELSKIEKENLNIDILENGLLDLENKVDLYFGGDEEDIKLLTSDETKYFEVSRQGSNEASAREHRGRVVRKIIDSSQIDEVASDSVHSNEKSSTAIIIPTATGLAKSILDATSNVRAFFKVNGIHDYDTQLHGPQNKIKIDGRFVRENGQFVTTEISLYRSNGRGDYRVWFKDLRDFASAEDKIELSYSDGVVNIRNLTKQPN